MNSPPESEFRTYICSECGRESRLWLADKRKYPKKLRCSMECTPGVDRALLRHRLDATPSGKISYDREDT